MTNILVLGTGCIGAVYASILNCANETRVTCLCRSNYETIKTHGLRISSTIFGELHTRPTVVRNVAEAITLSQEPFDFVVVCTKAIEAVTKAVIDQMKPALATQRTSIVLIQNGLGVERPFHNAFPGTSLISAVAYLPTTQTSRGVFVHSEVELLHLGLYPSAPASRPVELFAELIRRGGGSTRIHDDIQAERWCKIVANGSVNPICALSQCRDRRLVEVSGLGLALFKGVMQEIASVATSAGYEHVVTPRTIELQMSRILSRPFPGVQPSMMSDVLEGKAMEVQAVVGEIVKVAHDKCVQVPRLETIFVLLEGLDRSLHKEG